MGDSFDLGDLSPLGWGSRIVTGHSIGGLLHGGNVTDGGLLGLGKSIVNTATGQSDFNPNIQPIQMAADADNPATIAWQRKQALAVRYQQILQNPTLAQPGEVQALTAEMAALPGGPPTPTDQITADRQRVISVAAGYDPLLTQLNAASRGEGPSAAQDTLREGTARAQSGAYGMAASGNVLPGQRAAMLQAAVNNTGAMQQQSARDSAVIRANEVQGARSQLANTLGGKAQTLTPLYAGDQETNLANQNAQIEAEKIRAGIAEENAKQAGATTRSVVNNFGGMVGKGSGGGSVAA